MTDSLIAILDLEMIDTDLYRGRSPHTDRQTVFGGQVAAQALVAAGRTVDGSRGVHSLHAYFLLAGDPTWPIVYEVDRVRDGGSFTTRRVVGKQRGAEIFLLSASFQRPEEGFTHQVPMPVVPDPDEPGRALDDAHPADSIARYSSIDLRHVTPSGPADTRPLGGQQVWFRSEETLPDDPLLHVCVAAYASDLTLLGAALLPHGRRPEELRMASLDHAMWFHRPFRADEWLLYDMHSPSATGGRGLTAGRIHTRAGDLAVSVVQEGLMRVPRAERTEQAARAGRTERPAS